MIPYELYFWVVTFCGLVYSGISQLVRGKFVNMDRMKEIQKEMNELNKQYFDAMKKNNKNKMDAIKVKQDAVMPEFNGMMMGQLKVMGVIIIVFMSFMWVLGTIDPHLNDDVVVELAPEGEQWCGEIDLSGREGPWYLGLKAYEGDAQKSENGTTIFLGRESEFLPSGTINGEKMDVFADKQVYSENESAVVCAVPPANTDRVVATADSGTWFHVKLPFEIPILNTKTLNGVNIWFILVALVGGLGMARVKKTFDAKEKG
jgi:hypothetical protein